MNQREQEELGEGMSFRTVLKDRLGLPITITEGIFDGCPPPDVRGNVATTGYARVFAHALADPDEIWTSFEPLGVRQKLIRCYFARCDLPCQNVVILVEELENGWHTVAAFATDSDDYINDTVRRGYLNYRRRT